MLCPSKAAGSSKRPLRGPSTLGMVVVGVGSSCQVLCRLLLCCCYHYHYHYHHYHYHYHYHHLYLYHYHYLYLYLYLYLTSIIFYSALL